MIYNLFDLANGIMVFICPDQTTIDDGVSKNYLGNFVIGTQADIDAIVKNNKNYWIEQNNSLLSVNKVTFQDLDAIWQSCNLYEELDNDNVTYQIFKPIDGGYEKIIGLSNAKNFYEENKQTCLNYFAGQYSSFEAFPARRNGKSRGTQTL